MMNQELREFLRAHFRDNFECELFKGSMGEQHVMLTGMKGIVGIVAQAVAYFVHEEPAFAKAMIGAHGRLGEIFLATERMSPQEQVDHIGARQFAINVGAVIEAAIEAVAKYHQKRGKHGN